MSAWVVSDEGATVRFGAGIESWPVHVIRAGKYGPEIAYVNRSDPEVDPDRAKVRAANAALIAAAPDLYEALNGILTMAEDMANLFPMALTDDGLTVVEKARAALSAARGETK